MAWGVPKPDPTSPCGSGRRDGLMEGGNDTTTREGPRRRGRVNPMRWSIRNQILVPLIAIQAAAVAAIAIATATLAARRSERQIVDRLNGVIDALGDARFPYTAGRARPDAGPLRRPLRRLCRGRSRDRHQPREPGRAAGEPPVAAGHGPRRCAGRKSRGQPRRHALPGGVAAVLPRPAGLVAPGSLPRDELAAGAVGGRDAAPDARRRLARVDGPGHELGRLPHHRADRSGAGPGGPDRRRRLPRARPGRPAGRGRRPLPLDQSPVRPAPRDAADDPRDRALAPAGAARGRPGPSTAERADGSPDERAAPRPPASGPGRRPEPGRGPAATGDDRGTGQGPALAREGRATPGGGLRPRPARSRTSPSWSTRRASTPGWPSPIARGVGRSRSSSTRRACGPRS